MKVGNKIFYKNEPVIYFDSLKTSSLEGAATTVYATGGRGNSRLMAWEGERTLTFVMEDALISAESFMILSGAGLIQGAKDKPVYQHVFETTDEITRPSDSVSPCTVYVKHAPFLPTDKNDNYAYVMVKNGNDIISEPIIPVHNATAEDGAYTAPTPEANGLYAIIIRKSGAAIGTMASGYTVSDDTWTLLQNADVVLVDYYTARGSEAKQIEITPDKFGGNFYLEASTLFKNEAGVDMPAEFIIPNCKIQSNFTFSMSSTGDPSSFSFNMDAFPDYTRFDPTKKVLATIQIIENVTGEEELVRKQTVHESAHDQKFVD